MNLSPSFNIDALKSACPGLHVVTEDAVRQSHGRDWTRFRPAAPGAVAFPASLVQVQQLVAHAAASAIGLVPSGGRTGMSGGAVACAGELVVSFDRMRRILEFDPVDRLVTVEAGVVTASLQEFAREQGLYYPVSFAAEGSSQLGGNIATNAGGLRVIRHGLTRDRVAGLKVIAGRGEVLECNRGLVKNASGYDLRHLFVGSEGTLGLIVEATLWLTDIPPPAKVLLLGVVDLDALMKVFEAFRNSLALSAFEFLTEKALDYVCSEQGMPRPFEAPCPLYVVIEFDCSGEVDEDKVVGCFEACLEAGWLQGGLISHSERQAAELWRYRECITESITRFTPYKNDLSVRVSAVPEFLRQMDELLTQEYPDLEIVWYGHIGDGNLHMNVLRPEGMAMQPFESVCHELSEKTYALTHSLGGSISAEHGIGILKSPWLHLVRSPEEIELMRGIKKVFDPAGIFNPGKLLT
jgi:FAD/FMN-containing dehydrogenase